MKHLPVSHGVLFLENEILVLTKELNELSTKVESFEATLRSHLIELMIEERELYTLYKTLKKEKKEKRIAQKRNGKNYKARPALIPLKQSKTLVHTEEEKEKKRLYRETMLLVHPDKFSMDNKDNDTATDMTVKLIDIYKHQDLQALRIFNAYIKSDSTYATPTHAVLKKQNPIAKEVYLEREKEQLLARISELKNKHTYTVLQEYANPLSFIDELQAYYLDRIAKLKKRTRKAHS